MTMKKIMFVIFAKCDAYAASWAPVAEEYWNSHEHKTRGYENYSRENLERPDAR